MKTDNTAQMRTDQVWLTTNGCNIEEFAALVERTTNKADYPFAVEIAANALVYDRADVLKAAASAGTPATPPL